jgi:aminopeptidase N
MTEAIAMNLAINPLIALGVLAARRNAEAKVSRLTIFASLILMLAGLTGALAERPFDYASTPGRLPKDVRPFAYRIDLVPDLDQLATADGSVDVDFTGKAEIDVEVLRPTAEITINAVDLSFAAVSIDGMDAMTAVDERSQTATFRFPRALAAGRHTLTIAYSGKIIPRTLGLYYSIYQDSSGRHWTVTSDFEPGKARRAFPGWDEPVFKASFTLSAVLPESFQAISNMPVARAEPAGPGRKRVTFAPTPAMSSYLVVLAIGEYARIGRTIAGIDVGIHALSGRLEEARYALDEVTAQVLPYYIDYFDVGYPLPKLDQVAVADLSWGGMENWGGIIYNDSSLLFDPARSPQSKRQDVFIMVSHEIAHQWFGNLVTMAWWDNLWLNEGFASWMEKKVADRFNPAWKVWLQAHASREAAMARDAMRTSQPIQREIADESEAQGAFDAITYDKGQAFVRMLEAYLGAETFRDGLRRYMKAHALSSTTTADFWAALSEASGKPVAAIAAAFVEQAGIPLIRLATRCVDGETIAQLRQERFTINNPYADKLTWRVPVLIGRLGDGNGDADVQTVLVEGEPQTVRLAGCGKPVKANFGDVGYYRVQYDGDGFTALAASYRRFSPADRVNLVTDAWALVQAGGSDAKSWLDLTRELADESEYAIWQNVADALLQIESLARGSAGREAFRAYARELLRPVLERLGWDPRSDDDPLTLQLRTLVIGRLGRFGDQAVIAEAMRRFDAFVQDPTSLHNDLQDAVATVVGRVADRATFDTLHRLGAQATSTEEKQRYYYALAGTSDPALIPEVVAIAISDQSLPNGQVEDYLSSAAAASDDPDLLWKLVFEQRREIMRRLRDSERQLLLPDVARGTSDPMAAFQMKWADESRSSPGARHEAEKAVDDVEFKVNFRERLLPAVDAWILANRSR